MADNDNDLACVICGALVHPERRQVIPHVKTCSRPCAAEHGRRLRMAATRRWLARRRAERRIAQATGETT